MTLFAYSPQIQKDPVTPQAGKPVDEAIDAIENPKKHWHVPERETSPRDEANEPLPDIQPAEAEIPDTSPAKDKSGEAIQKWQKPKRSLKALTKVALKVIESVRTPPQPQSSDREIATKKQLDPTLSNESRNSPSSSDRKADMQSSAAPKSNSSLSSALNDAAAAVSAANQKPSDPVINLAKPLYRNNPPPKYPARARRRGIEGIVVLEVLVDTTGSVNELKILKSSGYSVLDRTAVRSVKKWQFEPGRRDGRKIKMWVRVPIRFKLN